MSQVILVGLRNRVYATILWPGLIAVSVFLLLWVMVSFRISSSFALGSLAWLIPNGLFAWRNYAKVETKAKDFLWRFYLNEIIKIVLIIGLLIATSFLPVTLWIVLLGFFVMQSIFWLSCFWFFK